MRQIWLVQVPCIEMVNVVLFSRIDLDLNVYRFYRTFVM